MSESLLPSRFLFRFAAPCRKRDKLDLKGTAALDEACLLPALCELEGQTPFATIKGAWSATGLGFLVQVANKKQPLWCRDNRLEDSDGIQFFIDTRDIKTIHRASRFCHRFAFLPAGGSRNYEQPVSDQMLIDRARENANPIRPGQLSVSVKRTTSSYEMACFIPAAALTGFHPADHPALGFTYRLFDREFGEQTWSCSSEFPFVADPSLWGTLELAKDA